ncbi:coenzyme F390 synthetase II [Methanothermobacter sp. CaT2]|uniref:Coenzyme F390 synthetase n=1 Tax=Methanothermobacter marburgensis (strain ATCC BAA-927 / DSM 2133 / JCM 14651 / NBRC 100331 / OCM 82 / Marburg) TaxID=79929 RepID=D9PUX9_METTM|nr:MULTISPECIES: phenylacetate--CoA ligase [Methanothermobacter]ADL58026.1 coenzyme F390 synthetase [Methanothermobacter marburgensis str. Marburg]WBF10215.1 phenylacetate--CoA ligase [Methanothermobacter marburgensis]BAM70941.1 coenzyme F390 synthetase II [Methanothermobacter sp. CaT2]
MIWNPEAECMSQEEKQELQLRRLQETVKRAYENVPYYNKRLNDLEVFPEDIETLDDIEKLPFTTKNDLRDAYPFGMFAVPDEDIVEVHTSSGTTGKPVVSGYTRRDLEIWSEVMARSLTMGMATKKDRIQNCYGYGLFTGGLGVHYGAQKIGATVIPISAGNTKRQIEIMQDFGTTIITCTPSYALYLAEVLEKEGVDIESLNLKSGIFGAEMWTEEMRNAIEERLGLTALNIYGLTEIIGPGVAQECTEKNGLHIFEDHFYPEIIDPKTEEKLPYGRKGELVLTTLTREGMPILRFRTKDITALRNDECGCGRTLVRMDRITGRSDDMLKIRGVIVFPSQIERALLKIKGLEPHYQIVVTRPEFLDELEVQVEASPKLFSDEVKHVEEARRMIEKHIHSEIGLRVNVTLVEPGSLPRSEGKAIRVIDKRKFD